MVAPGARALAGLLATDGPDVRIRALVACRPDTLGTARQSCSLTDHDVARIAARLTADPLACGLFGLRPPDAPSKQVRSTSRARCTVAGARPERVSPAAHAAMSLWASRSRRRPQLGLYLAAPYDPIAMSAGEFRGASCCPTPPLLGQGHSPRARVPGAAVVALA